MTTQKQATANKQNAQKSTGPRTAGGRSTSKMNAVKHGLTAAQITIADEDPKHFQAFYHALTQKLLPDGALEEQLVERIAISNWRLRRVCRVEPSLYAVAKQEDDDLVQLAPLMVPPSSLGTVFGRLVKGNLISSFSRYEAAIERSLYRALHELERVQARRKGEPVMAAVALDVSNDR
jgi:hypothetical protein